jgi:hypothetical protein
MQEGRWDLDLGARKHVAGEAPMVTAVFTAVALFALFGAN